MVTGRKPDENDGALRRAEEQSERSFGPPPHDLHADDRIERLGKRIGRMLSIILAAVLIIYLWNTYLAPE
jgi:hypothetical protein